MALCEITKNIDFIDLVKQVTSCPLALQKLPRLLYLHVHLTGRTVIRNSDFRVCGYDKVPVSFYGTL